MIARRWEYETASWRKLACVVSLLFTVQANAQSSSAFNFQGLLNNGGTAIADTCDMGFSLWDSLAGGTMVGSNSLSNVEVSNGLFNVTLDFGTSTFTGDDRWLEVSVQCSTDVVGTVLSPRLPVLPVPQALYASAAAPGNSLDAADGNPVDAVFVDADGQVGIGWPTALTTPQFALQVQHGAGTGTVPADQTAIFGNSASGYGVVGFSKGGAQAGVWGSNSATSGDARGVWGRTTNASGSGVYAEAWFSGVNRALHAKTHSPDGYAGYFEGPKSYFEGNVGIGTNAPSGKLHVVGNAGNNTGVWSNFSDRRLKKQIESIEPGSLDRLLQLRGVTYEYARADLRKGYDGIRRGWIAQQVEDVFPEWVSEAQDGMKMLTPVGFDAITVEALRELRAEKDAEIALLKESIAELRAFITELVTEER